VSDPVWHDLCESYEEAWKAAWQGAAPPRLTEYLARSEPATRDSLARALLALDAEYRPPSGYLFRGRLGRGGMGVVYRARREEGGRDVALKRPRDVSLFADFNNEFRALQAISHPNVVRILDVGGQGADRYFTMELVEGREILDYIPGDAAVEDASGETVALGLDAERLSRLRHAMRQLAHALHCLHRHGLVHRDVKSSNVLVSQSGRTVLMDFGLTRANAPAATRGAGTLDWMAPEQAEGLPVFASDWYSFGVLLYRALSGRHPPRGGTIPFPGGPPELNNLCVRLLSQAPSDRPCAEAVLAAFGDAAPTILAPETLFVGREAELAALREAHRASTPGRVVVVEVSGASGIGKSALIRHFLSAPRAAGAAILAGRCYEREQIRCKAFDSLLDELAAYLRRDTALAGLCLPGQVDALLVTFPQLASVPAIDERRGREGLPADPQEQRKRGLLVRLGGEKDLLLWVDDLQWADAESALLLEDLLRPPGPPRFLLIASYRGEDAGASDFLRRLEGMRPLTCWRTLPVGPLNGSEARDLAARLVGDPARAEELAQQADGHPFLLQELARAGLQGGPTPSLDDLIRDRVARLPDGQRHLLEVVAVSGWPLAIGDAAFAAGLNHGAREEVSDLQELRLIRVTGCGEVETYHDSVRRVVASRFNDEARRDLHRRLVEAIRGRAEPERLALHAEAAGLIEEAAEAYASAADEAMAELAFERAAALYRKCLALRPSRTGLRASLAEALAHAGCGAEAARACLDAAAANEARAFDLRCRAAGLFLSSGHLDEGFAALAEVLAAVGMSIPDLPEPFSAPLRNHRFRPRRPESIAPETLRAVDACWTASFLAFVDMPLYRFFQARHLELALAAGEPARVALGLGKQVTIMGWGGRRAEDRAERLYWRALRLARRLPQRYPEAFVRIAGGILAWLTGRFALALARLDAGDELRRQHSVSEAIEIGMLQHYRMGSLALLGRWRQLAQELPLRLEDARRRGDHYLTATLLIQDTTRLLAEDRPEETGGRVAEAMRLWAVPRFTLVHFYALKAEADIALYTGDTGAARRRLAAALGPMETSIVWGIQTIRVWVQSMRARLAMAAGDVGEALLASRRLTRERVEYADVFAALGTAAAAFTQRRRKVARHRLDLAQVIAGAADMQLHAAVAGRLIGLLDGDGERVAAADAWMASEGIVSPASITAVLAPGFRELEKG
jgi:hypothetical protein